MANRLAGSATVYTDGNKKLGSRIRAQLKSKSKFHVENRHVLRLSKDPNVEGEAGVLVTLEDGTVKTEVFLVSSPFPPTATFTLDDSCSHTAGTHRCTATVLQHKRAGRLRGRGLRHHDESGSNGDHDGQFCGVWFGACVAMQKFQGR
ncbi:hypothetical protein F4818DRAFT_50466 [Hypoxylon cercidicola]|nr:hypothetical protein F4818DRAFT_50466 [Hypoxylon cercidicola]